MLAIVIIPARYASTRLPGKPLVRLYGKPMIQHVYERAVKSQLAGAVYVATDSPEIYGVVEGFGGKAVMTSADHASGTDRVAEAAMKISASGSAPGGEDIIVNIQGDEPLIRPEMIDDVIRLMEDERASIGTLAKRIEDPEEIADPNVVKVVFDREGFALYFSRSPIPFHRAIFRDMGRGINEADMPAVSMFKHIGIYAFRKTTLLDFSKLPPAKLENIEKLEQLRALESGLRIKVGETEFETVGVDTKNDIERVEKCLSISL